jgi:prophage regulatory protein
VADVLPLRAPVAAGPPADQPHPALVADARRLAVMLCAGLRTVRAWDVAGKLPKPLRIGGRVVWRVDEIRAWIDAGAPDRETWEARRAARK